MTKIYEFYVRGRSSGKVGTGRVFLDSELVHMAGGTQLVAAIRQAVAKAIGPNFEAALVRDATPTSKTITLNDVLDGDA